MLVCDLRNHGRKGVEYDECVFREAFGDEIQEEIWNLSTQVSLSALLLGTCYLLRAVNKNDVSFGNS